MKTKLVFYFDTVDIPSDVTVTIDEPSVLPENGEIIYCKWPEFIKDPQIVKKIAAPEEGHLFRAEVLCKIYTIDMVTVQVLLHMDSDYKVL